MVRPVTGRIGPLEPQGAPHRGAELTADQKQSAREIIARFDPRHVSPRDKEDLREELLDAGIHPGEDLKEIFEEAGFDVGGPKERRERPSRRSPMQPPPRAEALSHGARGHLMHFLEKHEAGTVSREDIDSLSQTLRGEGAPTTGWLVDIIL